jgi:hypothetical protein
VKKVTAIVHAGRGAMWACREELIPILCLVGTLGDFISLLTVILFEHGLL